MEYKILDKKINFIDLHDFLSRLETGTIISHLHYNAVPILQKLNKNKTVEWEGNNYSKGVFLERLGDEEGLLKEFKLIDTPFGPDVILKFECGNGFTVSLKDEKQFAQIYEYLLKC